MTFAARRWRSGVVLVLTTLLVAGGHAAYATTLGHESFLSGWVLFVLVILLAAYNLRRKMPFLPVGSSALWLNVHVFIGFLSLVVFVLLLASIVPGGAFEKILAAAYVATAGSGVIGLFLSRYLPPRLSSRGENLLYERIPRIRRDLLERAEALAHRAVVETQSTTIADYYADRLRAFFDAPRNFSGHVIESARPRRRLLGEMDDLERYLDKRERELLAELRTLVVAKDDVDYQWALQKVLRSWPFVHVPVTASLLILTLVHVVLVHAFA